MKYYTSQIPLTLAERLKEKGMELRTMDYESACLRKHLTIIQRWENLYKKEYFYELPTYAEVFNWLMSEKKIQLIVEPYWDLECESVTGEWSSYVLVDINSMPRMNPYEVYVRTTWHETANAAIEKAIELI